MIEKVKATDQQTVGATAAFILKQKASLLAILSTKERKARVPKAKPGCKVKAVVAALHPASEAMAG